jgi:hypothetical protein
VRTSWYEFGLGDLGTAARINEVKVNYMGDTTQYHCVRLCTTVYMTTRSSFLENSILADLQSRDGWVAKLVII